MTYAELVKTWTNDMLASALTGCTEVRDTDGRLRSTTAAEDAFLAAVWAERRRRAA